MSDITYGAKSAMTGNFLFGIREPTERRARAALVALFGGNNQKPWYWGLTIEERPPEEPRVEKPTPAVKQTRIIRWVERKRRYNV